MGDIPKPLPLIDKTYCAHEEPKHLRYLQRKQNLSVRTSTNQETKLACSHKRQIDKSTLKCVDCGLVLPHVLKMPYFEEMNAGNSLFLGILYVNEWDRKQKEEEKPGEEEGKRKSLLPKEEVREVYSSYVPENSHEMKELFLYYFFRSVKARKLEGVFGDCEFNNMSDRFAE